MKVINRKTKKAILLMCMAGCLSLLGCAAAVPYAVGKIYLNKKKADIYITENESDIISCEFVKQVKASTSWGGLALQDEALQRVISDITHRNNSFGYGEPLENW